jgi:hypothetical protein
MPTFTQIGTAVVVGSGGQSSIAFTSIPSTFTDLCVKLSVRDSSSSTRVIATFTFNGSTSGYTSKVLYGVNGTVTGSENGGTTFMDWSYITANTATSSTFSNTEIYIPNYASSNNKSVSIDFSAETNSASAGIVGFAAGLWSNSAAITSITFASPSSNFLQHSTAYLYGVSNA